MSYENTPDNCLCGDRFQRGAEADDEADRGNRIIGIDGIRKCLVLGELRRSPDAQPFATSNGSGPANGARSSRTAVFRPLALSIVPVESAALDRAR